MVFSLSIQVEVTTRGAALFLPSLIPYGPVVPAGAALDAVPAPPRLPLPVLPSLLPPQDHSMATASGVWGEWWEEAFVSVVLVPPRPITTTPTVSSQMRRRSPCSLLLLSLLTLFSFPILGSLAILHSGGTAELFPWSSPTSCTFLLDPRTLHRSHAPHRFLWLSMLTTGKRASLEGQ